MMPAPVTPRGPGDPVEPVIRDLNDDYHMGVQLPDRNLSPARRAEVSRVNEQYGRSDQICRGIRFLYWQRDDSLHRALESFFNEAKAASQAWVPKPRADPATLPSSRDPPKARNPEEQRDLQLILIRILDRFKAQKATPLSLPTRRSTGSDTESTSPFAASPASAGSKRSFSGDSDQDAKRLKGVPAPTFASALDRVPSRQRAPQGQTSLPDRRRHEPESGSSLYDTSSSRSLFSQRDGQPSTQTSFEAGPQSEKRAGAVANTPSSQFATPTRRQPAANHPALPRTPSTRAFQQSPLRRSSSDMFLDSPSDVSGADSSDELVKGPANTGLQLRLQNIWPKFPRWLDGAPLAVAWEITRICLHCKVDLDDDSLKYSPKWATSDMNEIWKNLSQLDVFRGKSFPERPAAEVFAAALTTFESRGNAVLMSAFLEFNPNKTGPLFLVNMRPLRFDEGCRLTRRFGPDRFMEILIPSPTASNAPSVVKDPGTSDEVIRWLTEKPHSLVGRQWQAFYAKDAGYRKPVKDFRLGPEVKATYKERVHFFAEGGVGFVPAAPVPKHHLHLLPDGSAPRTELKVSQMLDWLLQLEQNGRQPHLKLFSRIQLGLSKTVPTVIFEPEQILHRPDDILSPIGKVMNDGIGRMSRSVARKIRDALGLSDIPSAVQGRMGSAKGMWLMDVADSGDHDWIETYPSQRKWKCDDVDPYHRTLEIRSISSELKSAGLNLQFLPVLEDRAKDRFLMRRAIGDRLMKDLKKQFDSQKTALQRPLQFRQWVNENWNGRSERVKHGQVPFLGGLPENKEEILNFLLNSGFDPKKQKYVQDLAWELQKQRCNILKTKLNIKVDRSAYIYMVVDFWGVLEENEVHVGFSSKFRAESDDESYTLLADCDVLVARSPAHFVSDVQRVRAVFKSELHALKDVIVFSAKGNVPLADKLSGGDYDGDMAWVCWDPDIVTSFVNADVPPEPELSAYLTQNKTTFGDLVEAAGQSGSRARHRAVYDMITQSFKFAMLPNYLGICTNYKEKLCYHNDSVSNDEAVILSSLVGKLVDQSKQGIMFDNASWKRLRKDHCRGRYELPDPAYKGGFWHPGDGEPRHIIDYLKFLVAMPAIDRELTAFNEAIRAGEGRTADGDDNAAHHWDPDLAVYYEAFKSLASGSRSVDAVLKALLNAIGAVEREWKTSMAPGNRVPYPDKVRQLHAKWCAIDLGAVSRGGSNQLDRKTAALLEQPYLAGRGEGPAATSYWALLRASAAFKAYYRTNPKFVWQMAGCQLAFIKAQMMAGEQPPLLVTPLMYAGLAPDARFVKQYVARLEGDGSEGLVVAEGGGEGEGGEGEEE